MQEPSESSPSRPARDTIPVRGTYILRASLITKDNAKDCYFAHSPF